MTPLRRCLHRGMAAAVVMAVLAPAIARAQALPPLPDPHAQPDGSGAQAPSPHAPPVAPAPASPPLVTPPRPPPPPATYTPAPEPEAATLLGSNVAHGAYVGPDAKLTTLADSAALLVGAQAGWVVDHVFVLGGSAYALASEASSPSALQTPDSRNATLSMTYGGARIAFVPAAKRTVHLVFGVLAGGGRIASQSSGMDRIADGFFVVEPDVAFEANVARPVRMAVGASYRFTGGTGLASLDAGALNGPTAFCTIKLGEF